MSAFPSNQALFVAFYDLHYGGNMVLRSSYFHNGDYCNAKMSYLYQIRPHNSCEHQIYKLHKHAMKHSYIPVDMQIASLHIIWYMPGSPVVADFFAHHLHSIWHSRLFVKPFVDHLLLYTNKVEYHMVECHYHRFWCDFLSDVIWGLILCTIMLL